MRSFKYYICDVFTNQRFGGNPLAVFPQATGLGPQQMQSIAREFNFSETTFVFPPETGGTRKLRIYTPTMEVPFAGHPNIGTAFVLATTGELGAAEQFVAERGIEVFFEEKAGVVPISIRLQDDATLTCELRAPQALTVGKTAAVDAVAHALSVHADEILTTSHQPQVASVGLPFLIVELRDVAALRRARPNIAGFEELQNLGIRPDVHLYVRGKDEFDIRARMYAPFDGAVEDPATGSANCALCGLLAQLDAAESGHFSWKIAQGVEMGRPSLLYARAEKTAGKVASVWIGGSCVMVAEGLFHIE